MALTETLVVYDNTLGAVMRFKHLIPAGDTRFDSVPLQFALKLDPQAYRVLQANPLLKQKLQLDMIPLVADRVARLPAPAPQARFDGGMKLRVEQLLKDCEEPIGRLVEDALERCAATNAAWRSYYKAQRKDLIFAAVGLTLSGVGVALGVASGGASLAIAIVAGFRSVVTAATKLAECARTAEDYETRIAANIKRLATVYGENANTARAMQIGGVALGAMSLTPAIELFIKKDLLPSFGKIKTDMSIYKGKLGHLYVAANDLTVRLFELLDQIDEWHRRNPGVSADDAPELTKVHTKIHTLLEAGTGLKTKGFRNKLTISSAYLRYERGMKAYEDVEREFVALQGLERHPDAMRRAAAAVKFLVNLTFTLANYQQAIALPAHASASAVASAMGVFNADGTVASGATIAGTASGWVGDMIGTRNDAVELAGELGVEKDDPALKLYEDKLSASYAQLPRPVPPPRPPRPQGLFVARPPGRPLPPAPTSATATTAAAGPLAAVSPGPPPPLPPRPANRIVIKRSTV